MTAAGKPGSLDPRIARIEQGIPPPWPYSISMPDAANAALADLCAWQEIAERHWLRRDGYGCGCCNCTEFPCPDRQAADAAIDRLDQLWGVGA